MFDIELASVTIVSSLRVLYPGWDFPVTLYILLFQAFLRTIWETFPPPIPTRLLTKY